MKIRNLAVAAAAVTLVGASAGTASALTAPTGGGGSTSHCTPVKIHLTAVGGRNPGLEDRIVGPEHVIAHRLVITQIREEQAHGRYNSWNRISAWETGNPWPYESWLPGLVKNAEYRDVVEAKPGLCAATSSTVHS